MATISPVVTEIAPDNSVISVVWSALTTTNADGKWISAANFADRSIQFDGTFGAGGTIKFQGSNDTTNPPTNVFELSDPQGNAIAKTGPSLEQVLEMTRWVRPFVSAGDGTTNLNAKLIIRLANPLRN